jgi:iron(III) transport system substrate-binding protein
MRSWKRFILLFALLLVVAVPAFAQSDDVLTIYSARREELVAPIIAQFTEDTGVPVEVRYGNLAEMVAMILEEGENSPADVFFTQDASGLGALAREDRLAVLPDEILERVAESYRADDGVWVGISGRARVLIYNTELVDPADLPASLMDLTDERWRGLVGYAPTNGPLQGQFTAMRVLLGDEATKTWLEGMIANDIIAFDENTTVVQGVAEGEVAMGLVNHYYLNEFLAEDPDLPLANHVFEAGDVGALVNVAAAGVLDSATHPDLGEQFIAYLLSEPAQIYFAEQTYEYPLAAGVPPIEGLLPLDQLQPPAVDLADLDDLEGTLTLMREAGALP